ncbi:MAG: hypothetical protein H6832_18210 [Planctomycetes bacterium]|nr:hypothetical protein [Planctomycetota bacterium]MCB9892087.1 hypothetical protein [Planctomycetota bacterium]MCB9920341.1 hypothetical protein [Planctomycetota bacterium]
MITNATSFTSGVADGIAYELASQGGIYCGPTAVAWIAAVWNGLRGRSYDHLARVRDKRLFADGPRLYRGRLPFFAPSMESALSRETEGELGLSKETYRSVRSMHAALERTGMPIIVRLACPRLLDGLHYTTLFSVERINEDSDTRMKLTWMDNGLYGMRDPGHPAFFTTPELKENAKYRWGCKQVVVNEARL